ncbi:DUF3265 domain-containing protein [Vibrio parahaemolyticus]|nr:DUF3265 domain-containing protein [Vibrio parahaemolyticus]EKA8935275.1 DUF3265 domain-containing protein [Vibrio parahaemolyticus]EKF6610919.1 DUF3265 domain-containing protein [Vibrio parahaemolyticus]MBE4000066.1 DUF3265 domain-containing protein [Vibrio parahaemolyticus]
MSPESNGTTLLTNCSRGIRNAWHFHYALNFVIKVVCGGFGIALLTP